MSNGNGKAKTLGVFALAMINVAAVLSLRNYPSMAVCDILSPMNRGASHDLHRIVD